MRYLRFLYEEKPGDQPALNGIRAFSISMVVVLHVWIGADRFLPDVPSLIRNWLNNFAAGVDLFFVLSGFLIYGGLLREHRKNGRISLPLFWMKRSLRIFPAYYVILAVNYLYASRMVAHLSARAQIEPAKAALLEGLKTGLSSIWADLLYVSNYVPTRLFDFGWSLSIEEQFYVILPPLAAFILFRVQHRVRIGLLVLLYLVPLILRAVQTFSGVASFEMYYRTETRFDALIAGMLCAEFFLSPVWRSYTASRLAGLAVGIVTLALLIAAFSMPAMPWLLVFRYSLFNAGFALLLALTLREDSRLGRFLGNSFFRPVARVSYGMYLWHFFSASIAIQMVLGSVVHTLGYGQFLLISILAIIFTFVVAVVMYLIVERQALMLRDWLSARFRSSSPTPISTEPHQA